MQYRLKDLEALKDARGQCCPPDVIDLLKKASVTNLSFKGKPDWEVTRADAKSLAERMGRDTVPQE